jgi:BlaI family transcriptional regulator, penicillinase repressor
MIKPSESELAILQVLWKQGPSTVKEVNEALSQDKATGYTTTLKLMQIMFEKALVSRTSEGAKGRSHIYQAAVSEAKISNHLLDSFIKKVFDGSAAKLVLNALGKGKTSEAEIREIRKLLDNLEKNKQDE